MANLFCILGKHTRSRGQARREGLQWVSRCRRCNAPMRRSDKGKWRIDLAGEEVGLEAVSD